MAYKSQVTNKYMGSTFKGAPRSNRNPASTELGQIVTALKEDLTPAVANWATASVEGQQDAAAKKIQSMYAKGKSMKDINKEILNGDHPDLEHKYTEAIVSGQFGRIEAYDAINKIRENIHNYKPKDESLEEFWQGYLPNFDEQGQFFTDGFAAVFSEYKAKALSADADERAVVAETEKVSKVTNSIVSDYLLNGYVKGRSWLLIESFGSQLPFDGKKGNTFINNEQKNRIMFNTINTLIKTATTKEQVEHAELMLEEFRGGKEELGSLASTYKAEDISTLRGQILARKEAIATNEWNQYTRATIKKETNFINDYFAYANGGTLSDGTVVDRNSGNIAGEDNVNYYDDKAEETLNEMLDFNGDLAASVVKIKANINELDKDQNRLDFIYNQTTKGVYTENPAKLVDDIADAGGNMHDVASVMSAWQTAKNRKIEGLTLFPFQKDSFWTDSAKELHGIMMNDGRLVQIEKDETKRAIIANTVINQYGTMVEKWYDDNAEPSLTLNNGQEWRKWNEERRQWQFDTVKHLIATYKTEDYYKAIKAVMEKQDMNSTSKLLASEAEGEALENVMETQVMSIKKELTSQNATIETIIQDASNTLTEIKDTAFIQNEVKAAQAMLKKAGVNLTDDVVTEMLLKELGLDNAKIDFDLIRDNIATNITNLVNDGFSKTMPSLVVEKDKWWTPLTDETIDTSPQVEKFLTQVLGELTGLGDQFDPVLLTKLEPTQIDLIAKAMNVDITQFRNVLQKLFDVALPY